MKNNKTPLSMAKNLGSLTERELNSIGITDLEQMIELGWEEVCFMYSQAYPKRINLNAFAAIIGAIYSQDWRSIDPQMKARAKLLLAAFKGKS